MSTFNVACPVPPELLYDILKHVLREYFHHCILDEEKPDWDAVKNLSLVSRLIFDTTSKILTHACGLDVSEKLKSAPRTASVMISEVRKQASNARNEPELFRDFLKEAKCSPASIIKKPFFAAYLAYLSGHLTARTLMANFVKGLVEGHYGPGEFRDVVIVTMKPLISAFKQHCNLVLPTGFCDTIRILIAEENLLLLAFLFSGSYAQVTKVSAATLVELAKPRPRDLHAEIAQCLANTAEMLKRFVDDFEFKESTTGPYLAWVSEARCSDLAREALVASGIIPSLKILVELPMIQSDPSGVADTARLILERWGGL